MSMIRLVEMQFSKQEMLQVLQLQLQPKQECPHTCKRHLQRLKQLRLVPVPNFPSHKGGSSKKHAGLPCKLQTVVE